jgi:hypothetical protein
MACTHAAAMSVLARFAGGGGTERRVVALGSAAARLSRAYSAQVEVFRRLRHGGQQLVRVEHVHINEGGQNQRRGGNQLVEESQSLSLQHR